MGSPENLFVGIASPDTQVRRHVEEISKNPKVDVEKVRSIRYLYEFDRYVLYHFMNMVKALADTFLQSTSRSDVGLSD